MLPRKVHCHLPHTFERDSLLNNAFYPLITPLIEEQTLPWWHANWIPLSDHKKEDCVEDWRRERMFSVNDQVITRFNYFDVHRIVANFALPSAPHSSVCHVRGSLLVQPLHTHCTDQRGKIMGRFARRVMPCQTQPMMLPEMRWHAPDTLRNTQKLTTLQLVPSTV